MLNPEQCRAARAWLGWSQDDLARRSGVALSTVRDFEKRLRTPIKNNLAAIQTALEAGGIMLISDGDKTSGIEAKTRISERDLVLPALDYLDRAPNGFMTTADLITALESWFEPQGEDAAPLVTRSDIKFTQIVRNTVSHRSSRSNLIGAGFATYDRVRKGLTLTDLGRKKLIEETDRDEPTPCILA